ncbi:MAG: hypothetical protein AB7P42_23035 [Gammaproteobacteria bacterium]
MAQGPDLPTKKDWQDLRKRHDIPGGAVKGASIGTAIDAVHKAAADGLFDAVKPIDALLSSWKTYQDKLAKEAAAAARSKDKAAVEREKAVDKFLDAADKQIMTPFAEHYARLKRHRNTVIDAPKMAAECKKRLDEMDFTRFKLTDLQSRLVKIGQLTSAMQVAIDTLQPIADPQLATSIRTYIRDAKKNLFDLEQVVLMAMPSSNSKKEPVPMDRSEDAWNRRWKLAVNDFNALEGFFTKLIGSGS